MKTPDSNHIGAQPTHDVRVSFKCSTWSDVLDTGGSQSDISPVDCLVMREGLAECDKAYCAVKGHHNLQG